jgi:hypothetical protein
MNLLSTLVLTLLWIPCLDCLNNLDETPEGADEAEDVCYEELDLSRGVEGVDYMVAYGT